MNVREEDRQKNSCPSRGLGLAAAAIGVGVGAALYYLFSKRPENPAGEGSTTSGWTCEQPHAFSEQMHENEDSYITISENSTTDTSVHDSDTGTSESSEESQYEGSDQESDDSIYSVNSSDDELGEFNIFQESSETNESIHIDDSFETNYSQIYGSSEVTGLGLESDSMDWDVTTSSVDVPVFQFPERPRFNILDAARNFISEQMHENEDSYITISENSTTDTSVHDSDTGTSESSEESQYEGSDQESDDSIYSVNSSDDELGEFNIFQESSETNESIHIDDSFETNYSQIYGSSEVTGLGLESDSMDWDVTTSSVDVPVFQFPERPRFNILDAARNFMSKEEETLRQQALYEEEQIRMLREEAYRERTWSLEECSICFDIILKDQEVTTLPCTHHFHSACITPWLQEQQTCPNCRKVAE